MVKLLGAISLLVCFLGNDARAGQGKVHATDADGVGVANVNVVILEYLKKGNADVVIASGVTDGNGNFPTRLLPPVGTRIRIQFLIKRTRDVGGQPTLVEIFNQTYEFEVKQTIEAPLRRVTRREPRPPKYLICYVRKMTPCGCCCCAEYHVIEDDGIVIADTLNLKPSVMASDRGHADPSNPRRLRPGVDFPLDSVDERKGGAISFVGSGSR
jgi:hypothetical protein